MQLGAFYPYARNHNADGSPNERMIVRTVSKAKMPSAFVFAQHYTCYVCIQKIFPPNSYFQWLLSIKLNLNYLIFHFFYLFIHPSIQSTEVITSQKKKSFVFFFLSFLFFSFSFLFFLSFFFFFVHFSVLNTIYRQSMIKYLYSPNLVGIDSWADEGPRYGCMKT